MALRTLADRDVDFVSGGMTPDPDIIVDGPGDGFGAGDTFSNPGTTGSLGGEGGGGGGDQGAPADPTNALPHPTSDASAAANQFADKHIRQYDALGNHNFQAVHDDLAHIYDLAKSSPNVRVDIGHGQSVSAAQALAALDHVTFEIRTNALPTSPGLTRADDNYKNFTVTIDTSATGMAFYAKAGDVGLNHVIFHEIGHVLNYSYNLPAGTDQASANTAGRSLERLLNTETINAPGSYN